LREEEEEEEEELCEHGRGAARRRTWAAAASVGSRASASSPSVAPRVSVSTHHRGRRAHLQARGAGGVHFCWVCECFSARGT
jgi:hypothetical protein